MHRIRDGIVRTPCQRSHWLSEMTGSHLYLKREQEQFTGSFKERGARNALLSLTEEEARLGVVAASAGNHALALCWHGLQLGIPVTVVMPTIAPMAKVDKCKIFGANVVIHGSHIGEAKQHALDVYGDLSYINGYDDLPIIAGTGTLGVQLACSSHKFRPEGPSPCLTLRTRPNLTLILTLDPHPRPEGMEMLEQLPDADAVVVPIGGGGLIAGIALAVKTLNPNVRVIGVEPQRCASYTAALAAGMPVLADVVPTLADGLAVPKVGSNAFSVARHWVDETVVIDEQDVALSVLRLLEGEKMVVEGGGATGLAAMLPGRPLDRADLKGKKVLVPLCGGNIDVTVRCAPS